MYSNAFVIIEFTLILQPGVTLILKCAEFLQNSTSEWSLPTGVVIRHNSCKIKRVCVCLYNKSSHTFVYSWFKTM